MLPIYTLQTIKSFTRAVRARHEKGAEDNSAPGSDNGAFLLQALLVPEGD